MAVDDWYKQCRRQGMASGQSTPQRTPGMERQSKDWNGELGKSLRGEGEWGCDDEEALQKARNWDDWKDTHPRGYGTWHNVG
ncbi:IGBP1 protein, partial [Eolophus roseicapillus]|nr:IGBP1 protein [Eolophus roseicapilla]